MSRVSVIIPLFDKEAHVGRALTSVLGQTFENFEVVVVDDGSTDGGPAVVEASADARVRMVRQENAGPGAAHNRGIRESSSTLVAFLDADDEWRPDHLLQSVRRLEENVDCALTVSGHERDDPDDRDEAFWRNHGIATGAFRLPADLEIDTVKVAIDFMHTSSIVARKEVVERYGGFYARDRCTYGEDSYLWSAILLNHEIYRDPTPLSWYHTEASELGVGRKLAPAVRPIVTDPDSLRSVCSESYVDLFEDLRALLALMDARRLAVYGDLERAHEVLSMVPRTASLSSQQADLYREHLDSIARDQSAHGLGAWIRNIRRSLRP